MIKMNNPTIRLHLQPKWLEGVTSTVTDNYMGLKVGNPVITALDGSPAKVEDGILKNNQNVLLNFGEITLNKFECLVAINPELFKTAMIGNPGILSTGVGRQEFRLTMTCIRNTPVDLPWIACLYLTE